MSLEDDADKQVAHPTPTKSDLAPRQTKSFEIRNITYGDLPCWYELAWDENKLALVLGIHHDFIKNAQVMTSDTPLVRALAEDFKFQTFSGDFEGDIGFEEVLKKQGDKEGFRGFALVIPQIKRASDEDCGFCKGSGRLSWLDEECMSCSGSGRGYTMDWQTVYAASASLTAFTTLLKFSEQDTSAPYPQLLTVDTITKRGRHGGSLDAEISRPLCQWLKRYVGNNTVPEAVEAMMAAHEHMFGSDYDRRSFKMEIRENGGLIMECPGQACFLYPDNNGIREGRGYVLRNHNVDSSAQQLTLLTGLAAIHDRARREMIERL